MKSNLAKSAQFLFALGAIGALACDQSTTDPGTRSQVVLEAGQLLGVLGGDFVSVLDTARLTITSDGKQQTMTRLFGAGDSETSFDVSLESGPATFGLDVISNDGTRLYRGETTSTISGNGFVVTITPEPDTAVMVVYPAHPTLDTTTVFHNDNLRRGFRAMLNVRNPGSATLNWHVASVPPLPTGFIAIDCFIPSRDGDDCLQNVIWEATTDEVIVVTFIMSDGTTSLPPQNIGFFSDVGNITVLTAPSEVFP